MTEVSNIIYFNKIVPRSKAVSLNYSIYTILGVALYKCSAGLERDGIVFVGDIIQQTEEQLLARPYITPHQLTKIKKRLEETLGYELGMRPIGWRRPELPQAIKDV